MTEAMEVAPGCPTFEDICTFCNEVSGTDSPFYDLGIAETPDDYVLYSSENFIVVPCIGPLTDWYVLIVPRRHTLSAGWLGEKERAELRTVSQEVMKRLKERSGRDVVLFEHGSFNFRDKGGSCHDHCHIHVVATEKPIQEFIAEVSGSVELEPCEDWIETAATMVRESSRSYLSLESADGAMIAKATGAPSAFFRKALVHWLDGEPGEHDWLVYPRTDRLRMMIKTGL
ncbi:HIT domain-containing protein [Streptomyces hawaiiensis]|uniref:HIT domain-containing protein n=1 Tax=Streptomyces hawaiiensis TaxID=67305 RepID=UPI00364CED04